MALALEKRGRRFEGVPLASYRDKSLYVMRTDALDRLGTRIEKRFTRRDIEDLMGGAGLERVSISPDPPYWCSVGYRTVAVPDDAGD